MEKHSNGNCNQLKILLEKLSGVLSTNTSEEIVYRRGKTPATLTRVRVTILAVNGRVRDSAAVILGAVKCRKLPKMPTLARKSVARNGCSVATCHTSTLTGVIASSTAGEPNARFILIFKLSTPKFRRKLAIYQTAFFLKTILPFFLHSVYRKRCVRYSV